MEMDAYQTLAMRTVHYPGAGDEHTSLLYCGCALAGEVGEACDEIKKMWRDDGGRLTEDRRAALCSELGDALWYLTMLAEEAGLSLREIASKNIDKLSKRHPTMAG